MKQKYAANVQVYSDTIYVDTATGEGVEKVLKKIDPLLCGQAAKSYLPGYTFEDIKQELIIIALDGIYSYDPSREVKLSTFLQGHIRNKFISKLRSENKLSNDAFGCSSLGAEASTSKIKRIREELNFSRCSPVNNEGETVLFENSIGEADGMHPNSSRSFESIDFQISLKSLLKRIDPKTATIVELIYFGDYTIKDAAEIVGLSGCAANSRLKQLAQKRSFKNIFNK